MNDVKLQEGHPVDENLRPLKVGGESTALEVSKEDVRVNNLYVSGTTSGVSATDDTKLPLAGGTMTGDIAVADGFVLDGAGDMVIDAAGGDIDIKNAGNTSMKLKVNASPAITLYESAGSTDDYCTIQTTSGGGTSITTVDDAGADAHFGIYADGDIILDSETGAFMAKKAGTEFSAANSAYAGMILGYTHLTTTGTEETFTVPTSDITAIAVIDADAKVSFVAPPSGNVEIEVNVYRDSSTSNESINFGISDNATYNQVSAEIGDGSSAYDLVTQYGYGFTDETDDIYMVVKFVACGLTAGTSYEWWIGAFATLGTTRLKWGGRTATSPDRYYPPFIIKATALPSAIHTQ